MTLVFARKDRQWVRRQLAVLVLCAVMWPVVLRADDGGSSSTLLTYAEIADLYTEEGVSPELRSRLGRVLSEPFVGNFNTSAGPPRLSSSLLLGNFIRVAQWNIERGLEYEALEAVLTSDERVKALLDPVRFPEGSKERNQILEQAEHLRSADVIILNEVDWGLGRSDYRNITAELAARLGFYYAFGVEFVELSPVHRSLNKAAAKDAPSDDIDAERYRGLHGTSILSRFPLENVRMVRFQNQPYDWFDAEKKGVGMIEKARRKLVKEVFLANAMREVRRGGRIMLIAEITDPRFPAGRATVVATHFEIRTSPSKRQLQLQELLDTIRPIRTPVIVAGDMNTSGTDMTPTTLERELRKRFGKPEYWVKTGLNQLLGFGMIREAATASLTFGRNHGDPTVRHIPWIMPNEERKFFSMLKSFRFADGGAFDFRGESSRSFGGKANTFANSNQRDGKGFVTTFRLPRPVKFIGKFKLDWIFVKPVHLFDPSDYQGPYLFAPHFGRTLGDVNSVVPARISDHSPITVDIPLGEPVIEKKKEKKKDD